MPVLPLQTLHMLWHSVWVVTCKRRRKKCEAWCNWETSWYLAYTYVLTALSVTCNFHPSQKVFLPFLASLSLLDNPPPHRSQYVSKCNQLTTCLSFHPFCVHEATTKHTSNAPTIPPLSWTSCLMRRDCQCLNETRRQCWNLWTAARKTKSPLLPRI